MRMLLAGPDNWGRVRAGRARVAVIVDGPEDSLDVDGVAQSLPLKD